MTTKTISELALATIDELNRRGRTNGTLARKQEVVLDDTGAAIITDGNYEVREISEEDCQVCLLGAMSSAYNPFHPEYPGYNEEPDWDRHGETMKVTDPEFEKFINAVAEQVIPLIPPGDAGDLNFARRLDKHITYFNDAIAKSDDDVIAVLRAVAEKHSA